MSKQRVQFPHDKYFKKSMENKQVAIDFIGHHLPKKISEKLNLSTLSLEKGSYLDEHLKQSASDLLFSVECNGRNGFIYLLIEHQRTSQKMLPFRLLKYIIRITEQHQQKHNEAKLPIVYPMIFYNGVQPYQHSTKLFDLFDDDAELAEEIFTSPFQLIDLNNFSDDELYQHDNAALMEMLMKYIDARDTMFIIDIFGKALSKIDIHEYQVYIDNSMYYLISSARYMDKKEIIQAAKQLPKPIRDKMVLS